MESVARKSLSAVLMTESDKIIYTFAAVGIYQYNEVRKEMEVL